MGYVRAFSLVLLASLAAIADDSAIGKPVPGMEFKDIRYVSRTLSDFGDAKAYVLAFYCNTCPVAQRYAPVLESLHQEFADQGVQFIGINVGPEDSIMDMARHAVEYQMTFPVVKDAEAYSAKAVGAERTPEVAVLDADRVLRYRGRVDDQFRVSGVQPTNARADLKEAILEVLAGEAVSVPTTPVEGCLITFPGDASAQPADVTFAEHVAPILYQNCVECHRPDTAAPFSLITYEQASGKASMIAEVVQEGRMPPWYAHPEIGDFTNERLLTASEKRTIAQWVRGGKQPGDLENLPEVPEFPNDKWAIGEPDLVLSAKEPFDIPATGYIPYQYHTFDYMFPEDTWVEGIEIMPSNPRVLHHCNMIYMLPGEDYDQSTNFLTGKVPGGGPADLKPGEAMLIQKGSVITLQIHYVTTGKPEQDTISAGFRYAKHPITKRIRYMIVNNDALAIPPGAPMHQVTAEDTLDCDATLLAMFTHMHLRGRDMTFLAHLPDGETRPLLNVPNYSFDWQMTYYVEPGELKLPKGTRIECIGHFDNSPFNPFNPDPTVTVEEGPQTFEEMMYGFFFYTNDNETIDIKVDPTTGQQLKAVADARIASE
ncbi:MAG: redoxin domain-containing protein [Candidatus Hydrogenedentes bacterium]|nr:redoxin domain-containing protein [Candidatus Hydrogenedentota bacterium]